MRGVLWVLLLPACGGNFVDRTPRCEHDVFDWFGGLVEHLDKGDGLAFNYEPEQGHIAKVAGGYITNNADTDFYWYTTYSNGYYLTKSTTQGIGTAYENGDVDLLLVEDVEDVLGDTWRYVSREERGGCKGRISEMSSDTDSLDWSDFQVQLNNNSRVTDYNIVSKDRIEYTQTYKASGSVSSDRTGFWLSNLTGRYTETWENGQSEGSSEMDVSFDGTASEAFWAEYPSNDGRQERTGTRLYNFDGSQRAEYTQGRVGQEPDWEIVEDVSYDGSEEAVWTASDGTVCDLEVDVEGRCTYECDNGQSGNC